MVREGLRRMLELAPDMRIVAEASSGQEALLLARTHSPQIILMDIKMPGMDGVEATRLLKQEVPQCKVLVLTLFNEYLPNAIQSGADGYMIKDVRREELVQGIRDVLDGRSPVRLSMEQGQLGELLSGSFSPYQYSDREMAVLRMVADGSPNREIAQQLAMSEATVKRVLRQASEKLGARNRSEAVAEAMKRNLL